MGIFFFEWSSLKEIILRVISFKYIKKFRKRITIIFKNVDLIFKIRPNLFYNFFENEK